MISVSWGRFFLSLHVLFSFITRDLCSHYPLFVTPVPDKSSLSARWDDLIVVSRGNSARMVGLLISCNGIKALVSQFPFELGADILCARPIISVHETRSVPV